jgi:chromosome segregation ATPase
VDKYYKHLDTLNNTWAKAFNVYNDAKMGAGKIRSKIEMLQNDFNAARTAYENVKKTVFTPQTGKCPYVSGTCEKLEKVLDTANAKSKAKFDKEQKKEINKLIQEGIRLRDELKAAQDELKTVTEQEAASEADYKEKLSEYEAEKNNPPEQNIPDMTELDKQISEFSERISEAKTIRANIDGTNEIIARLNAENADLDKKIEVSNALVAQKESEISVLEDQLKDDVQKCANIEMRIDMIQDFSMKKNAALSNAVNKHFHYINFKLFDKTIEGNEYETLKIMVNGTDYMNGLNHGARILADVDLVQGLQEMNGLNLPIWIDDSESLDPDKIPNTKQQLIVLRRTDADHLTVKEI